MDAVSEAESKPSSDIITGIEQMVEAVLTSPGCEQIVEQIVENMDTNVVIDQMAEAIKIAVLAEKILVEASQGMVESTEPGPEDEGVLVDKDEEHVKTMADIEDGYSQAHGSKIVWETDVNLLPPGAKEGSERASEVIDFYNSLQYTLYETGCPETVDRTDKPRAGIANHNVAIAILSAPCECMGLLLEGGEQCPDGMHLILSSSWITKKPNEEKPGLYSLYISKAITFHKGGVTYLDEFRVPRRVTYFLNYMTKYVTSGFISDEVGENTERNLDCPMSTSIPLCKLVDNKIWTRSIMIGAHVDVPVSLNFLYRCPPLPIIEDPRITVVWKEEKPTLEEITEKVKTFTQFVTTPKIVVKPSGPMCFGSVGVSFHERTSVDTISEAVEKLFDDEGMEAGCGVLVETFVEPVQPRSGGANILWTAKAKQSARIRATICRDHDNRPVTTCITCGMASKNHPINGDNTVIQTLDTTLTAIGVTNQRDKFELESEIRNKSEKVMAAMMEYVDALPIEVKVEQDTQIDVIGIDFFLTEVDGKIRPVAIEVNGHDCTINCQIFDFLANMYTNSPLAALPVSTYLTDDLVPSLTRYNHGLVRGRSIRPFIRSMVARSQRFIMRGKKVLVIGAGGYSKRNLWPAAAKCGIEIIMVETDPNHLAKDYVTEFIHFDFHDHKRDAVHAKNIINILLKRSISVNGCVTFWEDCVPLAAMISETLGTNGSSTNAAYNAKQKSRTQRMLVKCDGDIPHWPRTCLYAADAERIRSRDDCMNAATKIGFPSILKLEHGSSGVGVTLLSDLTELQNKSQYIFTHLGKEEDFPGIGLGFDNSMVLTEFHEGSEHDVDVVIYNRKLVGAFISDNGPTNKPYFTETAALMPSILPADKQAQLIAAAFQCCTEIGLANGTYNVEMKMTSSGPKLIEINARMGGFYLREWVQHLYGVDLMVCALQISCGVKPYIPIHPTDEVLMGIMLIPTKHGRIWEDKEIRQSLMDLEEKGEIIITLFSEEVEDQPESLEEPFCNVAVRGKTVHEAKDKLLKLCEKFGISQDVYPVEGFVEYF